MTPEGVQEAQIWLERTADAITTGKTLPFLPCYKTPGGLGILGRGDCTNLYWECIGSSRNSDVMFVAEFADETRLTTRRQPWA